MLATVTGSALAAGHVSRRVVGPGKSLVIQPIQSRLYRSALYI